DSVCVSVRVIFCCVPVSVDRMDITKGFLEDISRPASSEIRRPSRDGGRSLEVLSADQVHRSSAHERTDLTAENSSDQEESDEENEDPELREAIKKMKRLDRVLALRASAEREVKQRGKQQHQRLWQELQVRLWIKHTSASYRRLCALLTLTHLTDRESQHEQQRDGEHQTLSEASGNWFLLTQQEKERIEELLKDLEEEENSICEGFGPEPSELHSLRHIDSRLQLLLPVQDFLSVRSPSQVLISADR
uniref:Fibrous sheath-interacting protein 1 n=1 Tax=Sinocyclocheilus grahami TaxID=75366 RepID=A0A672KLR4_SINGR